ncbi:MAG: phenylacetate-CoA oxygenase subunit PaaC, partial [Frankiales bacterium]|nr:phenylacetate-CoA oxygenase subunit PaaC [Frankiales bacterium]
RDEPDWTNALLMEVEGGDFGRTMARQLLVAAYQLPLWQELMASADSQIAGVAGKAGKEVAYHLDHATTWVVRLGDGTPESHHRMQTGLDDVWPYSYELFERDELLDRLVARGIAADPDRLAGPWRATVEAVLAEATLTVPETTWRPTGGRSGRHTTTFGFLLAELQHLHRSHPGARW